MPWPIVASDNPPDHLYHYTSTNGVRDILTSREFWLTGFESQNDATEVVYGLERIAAQIRNLLEVETSAEVKAGLELRLQSLEDAMQSFSFDPQLMMPSTVAVFCMSAEPDDLSQWRAYSRDGAGFALAINTAQLVSLSAHMATLVRCHYGEADIPRLVQPLYDSYAIPVRSGRAADAPSYENFWSESVALAARIKHPKFSAEREWRLIQTNVPIALMETVVIGGKLRSVLRLSWDEHQQHNPVWKVIIGPQEGPEIVARSLGPLLDKCCGSAKMFVLSEVPYRPR